MSTETRVRVLNDAGLTRFQAWLDAAAQGGTDDPPFGILSDAATSAEFDPEVKLESREFTSKREMANYLIDRLSPCKAETVLDNRDLWSWMALFYIDQICPPDQSGVRKASRSEQYILAGDYRRNHRHLLATPYEIARMYPDSARALLSGPADTMGDFTEQLASRQELVTNEVLQDVVDALYYDAQNEKPKVGARSKRRPGSVRRLIQIKAQLDLTYDFYSLDSERILALLPAEFDSWKEQ